MQIGQQNRCSQKEAKEKLTSHNHFILYILICALVYLVQQPEHCWTTPCTQHHSLFLPTFPPCLSLGNLEFFRILSSSKSQLGSIKIGGGETQSTRLYCVRWIKMSSVDLRQILCNLQQIRNRTAHGKPWGTQLRS